MLPLHVSVLLNPMMQLIFNLNVKLVIHHFLQRIYYASHSSNISLKTEVSVITLNPLQDSIPEFNNTNSRSFQSQLKIFYILVKNTSDIPVHKNKNTKHAHLIVIEDIKQNQNTTNTMNIHPEKFLNLI